MVGGLITELVDDYDDHDNDDLIAESKFGPQRILIMASSNRFQLLQKACPICFGKFVCRNLGKFQRVGSKRVGNVTSGKIKEIRWSRS